MNPPAPSERVRPYFDRLDSLAGVIRENADRAEREAQMPQPIADAMHEAGMFRIFLPRGMGGGEFTIPDSLHLVEEVSRIDASVGWNLAICSGGPLFGNCISRMAFETIYGAPRGLSAGSLNPMTSSAVQVDGGWRFSGRARYASGSGHATHLIASAIVLRDGAPRVVDGVPELRAGLFPIDRAKILNTWSTSGMRGTGSNDCVFEDVFVPDEFTFDWVNAKPMWRKDAFANIPLTMQIAGGLTAVILGTARHALDALGELARAKVPVGARSLLRERPTAQIQFAKAQGMVGAARAYFYEWHYEMWRKGEAQESFSIEDHAHARLANLTAARLALEAIDLVADAAGMNATSAGAPIERCWRDAHTAAQHVLLNSTRFEVVGRVLFGLDPNSFVI